MNLSQLRRPPNSKHRKKRVGRGPGSGHGKTSGRGHKGSSARSGGGVRPGFEGGQMPLVRRVPKRGFTHIGEDYAEVNVELLNRFEEGERITPYILKERGIIKGRQEIVKILGHGKIKKPLHVAAHRFSKGARQKIEAAGGKVEVISHV